MGSDLITERTYDPYVRLVSYLFGGLSEQKTLTDEAHNG